MTEPVKQTAVKRRFGDGTPGPGRPKGKPNKTTTLLKDAILEAATKAGGKEGLVGYLTLQASENPTGFMTLLGKVLPLQVNHGDADGKPIAMPTLIALVPGDNGKD